MLKTLGLTNNEIKAYLSLLSTKSSTAGNLANNADIPRSKIYGVLDSLVQNNWVNKDTNRPANYYAKNPDEIIKPQQIKLNNEINKVRAELNVLWQNREELDLNVVQHVVGLDHLEELTFNSIKNAKDNILFLIRFMTIKEFNKLYEVLIRKGKAGIPIDLYIHPDYMGDDAFIDNLVKLSKYAVIRVATMPSRVLICDGDITLLSLPIVKAESSDTSFIQTVVMKIPNMISMLEKSLRQTMNEISHSFSVE